jgi:hypothetical protein
MGFLDAKNQVRKSQGKFENRMERNSNDGSYGRGNNLSQIFNGKL